MKLIIDIGNTLVKYAVFDKTEIVDLRLEKEISVKTAQSIVSDHSDITIAFVSSVRNTDHHIGDLFQDKFRFIEFNYEIQLPFINKYQTPETLGKDRIAAAVGAAELFPVTNVLSIDAGTCITYDMLTKKAEYLGGGISPGIQMRFNALHTFTGKLPLVNPVYEHEVSLIGKTTEDSILSGVQRAVLAEVDGMIDQYKVYFPDLKIVVTGGDYNYFDKYLKNNIFASPNLVLIGLKKILDFNEEK